MPYQYIEVLDLPSEVPAGGRPAITFDIGSYWQFNQAVTVRQAVAAGDHFHIQNLKENKNIRMGSRSLLSSSGSHSAVQIKPSGNVTGTMTVTGLEVSPRFQAGIAGANLRAILADPVLKAGSGDISGQIVAVEANIDFGISGTRTITGDVSAFSAFLAVPSTYTYSALVAVLRVRGVNIKSWDALINVDDENTGVTTSSDPSASTQDRWMPIYIGTDKYYIRLYD